MSRGVLVGMAIATSLAMGGAVRDPSALWSRVRASSHEQLAQLQQPSALTPVGQIGGRGNYVFASAAPYVYLSAGPQLLILDASDPSLPIKVGRHPLSELPQFIAVASGIAYLANGAAGLQLVDVRDPSAPRELASIDTLGQAMAVAVADGLAYVADGGAGLRIIDVHDPQQPRELGELDTPGTVRRVAVLDSQTIFVMDQGSAVHVIDVGEPRQPREVGTVQAAGSPIDLAVAGGRAYVLGTAGGQTLLQVLDVTDPRAAKALGQVEVAGATAVTVSGTVAYVPCGGSLCLVDVSDASHPRLASSSADTGFEGRPIPPAAAIGLGDLAYLVPNDGTGATVRVVDVSDPRQPRRLDAIDTLELARAASFADGMAYVIDHGDSFGGDKKTQLQTIDLSDPRRPRVLGQVELPETYWDIVAARGTAFLPVDTYVRIFDVRDPRRPHRVSSVTVPGYVDGMSVVENRAYIGYGEGFAIVDVSTPASPSALGTCDVANEIDVKVIGARAYVGYERYVTRGDVTSAVQGIAVYDVTNARRCRRLGSMDLPSFFTDVAAAGDVVFVGVVQNGLHVLDFSNPGQPRDLGMIDPHHVEALSVAADVLYVGGPYGLSAYDMRDPRLPTPLAHLWLTGATGYPGGPEAITVSGEWIYSSGEGIRLFSLSDPRQPRQLGLVDLSDDAWSAQEVHADARAAYALSYDLRIVDATDPRRPVSVARLGVEGRANVLHEGIFYAASSAGVTAVDVRDPRHPHLQGNYELLQVRSMAASGRYLYVADYLGELNIYDLAGASRGTPLGTLPVGSAVQLLVADQIAYLLRPNLTPELIMVDVGNPRSPTILEAPQLPESVDAFTVADGVAYIINRSGLQLFDVHQPRDVKPLGTLTGQDLGEPIVVANGVAYAVGRGLVAIDVHDPMQPVLLGSYDGVNRIDGLAAVGRTVYVAGGDEGLVILELRPDAQPTSTPEPSMTGTPTAVSTRTPIPTATTIRLPRLSILLPWVGRQAQR